MADFEIWDRQLLPQGQLIAPKAGPSIGEAFGQGLMDLAETAGKTVESIRKTDEWKEEKEWEINQPKAAKILADTKLKVIAGFPELRTRAKPGLEDYPDLINGSISSATDEALKGVSDPRMQEYIRAGMDEYRVAAVASGIDQKVTETFKLRAAELAESAESQKKLLLDDPGQYESAVKTVNGIIDGVSAFSPGEKEQYKRYYARDLALTAMHSLIGKDSEAAEKLLSSGKLGDALTADDQQAFRDDIKSIHERRRVEAQIQADNLLMKNNAVADGIANSAFDSAITTGTYDGKVRDQLRELLPKVEADKLIFKLDNARHVGQDVLAVRNQSSVADSRLLRALDRAKKDSDDPLADFHYQQVWKAVDEKRKALEEDSAAYAVAVNEDARAAWDDALRNRGDPDKLNLAVKLTQDLQKKFGVWAESTSPVPHEIAGGILEQVKTRGNASDIAALQKSFGINYPYLMGEISDRAGPLVATALMLDQPRQRDAQNVLLNLSRSPDEIKNLEKLMLRDDDSQKASLKNAIAGKLDGLRRSFLRTPGGEAVYGKLNDSAYALALNYMHQGESADDAAAHAAGDVGASYYKTPIFHGQTYRVPVRYSTSGVEQGIRGFLDNLATQPLDRPGDDPDMTRETIAESLKQYGWWSTLPDESGLQLHFQNGTIATSGGREIIVTWRQLELIASHHPIDVNPIYGRWGHR